MAILKEYPHNTGAPSVAWNVTVQAKTKRDQVERVCLSERDYKTVTEALDNPPAPTDALRKMVRAKYGR